jgi:hypothetical protein
MDCYINVAEKLIEKTEAAGFFETLPIKTKCMVSYPQTEYFTVPDCEYDWLPCYINKRNTLIF